MAIDIETALAAARDKRGYLLAHHGLLALQGTAAIAAYDQFYETMTLAKRSLSDYEKEYVWLGILIVSREPLATHHLSKFFAAGGTSKDVNTILRLTGALSASADYQFVQSAWRSQLPDFDMGDQYLEAFDAVAADLSVAQLLAIACQSLRSEQQMLALHLQRGYEIGLDEAKMAEAMTLAMLPGGVPVLANAAETWRGLIERNEVDATADFKAWAMLAGQHGHQPNASA